MKLVGGTHEGQNIIDENYWLFPVYNDGSIQCTYNRRELLAFPGLQRWKYTMYVLSGIHVSVI